MWALLTRKLDPQRPERHFLLTKTDRFWTIKCHTNPQGIWEPQSGKLQGAHHKALEKCTKERKEVKRGKEYSYKPLTREEASLILFGL